MIVGLTGGIGSGKTTVASIFNKHFNIPVYISDIQAKKLISEDKEIQKEIEFFFGKEAFFNGEYNRNYIGKIVFNNPEKLKILNTIIHPRVQKNFLKWYKEQKAPYVLKESAILFESGSNTDCRFVIGVIAPFEKRLERISQRDSMHFNDILKRMQQQKSDDFFKKNCDFIIENNDISQLLEICKLINSKIFSLF